MPVIFDHQPIDREAGSYVYPPSGQGNIPNALTKVRLRLARQTTAQPTFWPAGVLVTVMIQDTLVADPTEDDWRDVAGFSAVDGGIITDLKTGGEAVETRCEGNLHLGTGRLGRILYQIVGGDLVSQLTLEAI